MKTLKASDFLIAIIAICIALFYSGYAFAAASISLTGGSWEIGIVAAEAVEDTASTKWTVTNNDSGGTENVLIRVSSSGDWTVSGDGTVGPNEFALKINNIGGDSITTSDTTLVSDLANNDSYQFGLWFKAPTESTSADEQTITVTLTATGWQFACGNNVTFTYKGSSVTYGTVSSQGECWMDRNLGADPNIDPSDYTGYADTRAYGDLFQWGRLDDGHQSRDSGTTTTRSSTDEPGHGDFITHDSSPYDWRNPQNNNLWQGVNGTNNPCPAGWRIPTEAEWNTERTNWSSNNYNGAFASPLKLTAAGLRHSSSAALHYVGSYGHYWSSTVGGAYARYLHFLSSDASFYGTYRAYGFSVRCILD
jgi:uncharacterized protein (TIGR02145 family)